MKKLRAALLVGMLSLAASAQALQWFENSFCKLQVPTEWGQAEAQSSAFVRFWTPAEADPGGNVKARIDVKAGRVSGGLGMDMFGYMEKDEAEQS